MIIGVDFDGTIVKSAYPNIGRTKFMAIPVLKWLTKRHTMVLWTCRMGKHLEKALSWCRKTGITFDYVNENTPERISQYGGDCRKLSCDLLVDDMAGFVFWPWVAIKVMIKGWKHGRRNSRRRR